jgi:WD40 repeat protein
MSVNPGRKRQKGSNSPGISRRGFIQGASAAGAAVIGGYVPRIVRAADQAKPVVDPKRPTCIAPLDNTSFATCDDEGIVRRWSITAEGVIEPKDEFNDHATKATFVAAANPLVLTAGYDDIVVVRNTQNNNGVKKFTKHKAKKEVWAVAAAPDGTVISATNDGQILQWNSAQVDASALTEYSDDNRDDPVGGLAFVPPFDKDKPPTRFLSTHSHGDINLWTIGAKAPPKTFSHRNSHHVNAVAVTSDGKRFVSAGFDMTLRVWDVNDPRDQPQPIYTLRGHRHWIWRIAISHDDGRVASASQDGTVRLWDIRNGVSLGDPIEVGARGSMGVMFIKPNDTVEFLVYTANLLPDPNRGEKLVDQVRYRKV